MNIKLGKRKVWYAGDGGSLVTSLPKVWRDTHNIDSSIKLDVEMNEEGWLILKPIGVVLDE